MYRAFEHDMVVAAPPDRVFPLLCPVRERDWIEGWDADIVRSTSGVAELGCVFATGEPDARVTWVVDLYEPPRRIGFVLFAPDRFVERLGIEVRATAAGSALAWRRDVTALGSDGDRAVELRLAAWPQSHRWLGDALAHHLATGGRLPR